ncbi:hypothetical protein [Embleya scabrispora]|uniref:hypothetical protein n=1 Tax=Embleya scabrispora TaxID=159449 RepID=UPI0003A5DA12|nr:hypothetical protein [Embleya scabrispora]MYS85293.1 hypothetical protein [Streptomyces sp. SID5474]
MRKRAALLTTALAIASMSAIGTTAGAATVDARPAAASADKAPAQAAAGWMLVNHYTTYSQCVDAGQQYQREGFSQWKCPYDIMLGYFALYVR